MMTRISISDLNTKDEVISIYYVKYIALMDAKDGKKYLNLILADGTGEVESRIWSDAEVIYSEITKNNFVRVHGKVNFFQGRKQFIVTKIEKLNESEVDLGDFVAKAKEHPDKMYDELLSIVSTLSDAYIKKLLGLILEDQEIKRRLKFWQAGKSIHHAYQSGLLEHILSCTRLAKSLSSHYSCNENYVVAGAILHDLCKVYELSDGLNVDYTEEGKLVGHLVKGVEIVDRFSYRIENFPYQMKLHLKHILLSHHGEYEFGSPKIPQTTEAMLVHLIDLMDSKIASFREAIKADNNTGHWTSYVKHLDRIIYKEDLPFYPEMLSSEKVEPKKNDQGLKQNLGSMLKDFKIQKGE